MPKPEQTFCRAWQSIHRIGGCPLPSMDMIALVDGKFEALTIHTVKDVSYASTGEVIRFETHHKIYIKEVKDA